MANSNLTERTFLDTLAAAFASHRDSLVAAISATFTSHPKETYLIEVDPVFLGLHFASADLEIVTDFDVPDADAEAYEELGIDVYELARDAIWDWIADCWYAAGGTNRFPVAYANLHGYYDQYFNLSSREWTPTDIAFPNSEP